jgi:hypothetical protein
VLYTCAHCYNEIKTFLIIHHYRAKGKIVHVSEKIDKYIAESKDYRIENYFRKGLYLDCKDDYNFCVSTITDTEEDGNVLNIHFDNWSSKYDEVSF